MSLKKYMVKVLGSGSGSLSTKNSLNDKDSKLVFEFIWLFIVGLAEFGYLFFKYFFPLENRQTDNSDNFVVFISNLFYLFPEFFL